MAKKVLVNSKTGEIIEAEELCPYRTIVDAKEYKDGETYEEGTSVTSLEGYEPLESIVARCMRTTRSPNGTEYQVLDVDALKAEETQTGVYDASGAKDIEEAFATADPTDAQGFDLADASAIQNNLQQKQEELSTQQTNDAPLNSKSEEAVVGNSDSAGAESENFPEKGK